VASRPASWIPPGRKGLPATSAAARITGQWCTWTIWPTCTFLRWRRLLRERCCWEPVESRSRSGRSQRRQVGEQVPAAERVATPLEEARKAMGPYADALVLDQLASGRKAREMLGWQPHRPDILEEMERGSYAGDAAKAYSR
jgi:hypothetical protein